MKNIGREIRVYLLSSVLVMVVCQSTAFAMRRECDENYIQSRFDRTLAQSERTEYTRLLLDQVGPNYHETLNRLNSRLTQENFGAQPAFKRPTLFRRILNLILLKQ